MQKFVEIDPLKPVKDELNRVFKGLSIDVFVPEDFSPEQVPHYSPCLFDEDGVPYDVLETNPREEYVSKIESLFEIQIDRYNVSNHYLARSPAAFVLYCRDEIVVGVVNRDMCTISIQDGVYMSTLDEIMLEGLLPK